MRCSSSRGLLVAVASVVAIIIFVLSTSTTTAAMTTTPGAGSSSSSPQQQHPTTTNTNYNNNNMIMATTAAAARQLHVLRSMPDKNVIMKEITLQCSDGMKLAAQSWQMMSRRDDETVATKSTSITIQSEQQQQQQGNQSRNILCLHGWMDNCRSFHALAPQLATQRTTTSTSSTTTSTASTCTTSNYNHVVALDLVGHGWSTHKQNPQIVMAEHIQYVADALEQLEWTCGDNNSAHNNKKVILCGHSMGAAISSMYAAAFPEHVEALILLEGAGPLARKPRDTARHIRQHVQRRRQAAAAATSASNNNNNKKKSGGPRIYESLEQAIKTRCYTARNFPGKQYLTEPAAREMVLRGTREVVMDDNNIDDDNNGKKQVQFRHDPRLQWPSIQYYTDEQVRGIFHDIQCPVGLFLAEEGWPYDPQRHKHAMDILKPKTIETLPGSHHFHADPDSAPLAAERVMAFLSSLQKQQQHEETSSTSGDIVAWKSSKM